MIYLGEISEQRFLIRETLVVQDQPPWQIMQAYTKGGPPVRRLQIKPSGLTI